MIAGLKCAIAVLLMAGPVAAHAIDPKAALGAVGSPGDTRTRVEGGRFVEIAPPTRSDRGLNVGIAFGSQNGLPRSSGGRCARRNERS